MFEKETAQPGLVESLHLLGATILAFESIKMNNRLKGLPFRLRSQEVAWRFSKQDDGRVEAGTLTRRWSEWQSPAHGT